MRDDLDKSIEDMSKISDRDYSLNSENISQIFKTGFEILTSKFLYFGGFIGQGNISKKGLNLPNDASIEEFNLEIFLGSNAQIYVNNNFF